MVESDVTHVSQSVRSTLNYLPLQLQYPFCILSTTRLTGASEPKPPFPLLEAEKFLRQLYPELDSRGYVMSVELSGTFELDWTSMPRLSVELGPTELGHAAT
jgi:hypothetical protein